MGTHPIFESDFDCLTENNDTSPVRMLKKSVVIEGHKHRQKSLSSKKSFKQLDEKARHELKKTIQQSRQSGVSVLDLSDRNIFSLCSQIADLSETLKVLHLQKNKIQSLPSELGCLRLLELLMLSENSLLSLPDSLANLQRLKRLDLGHNKVEGTLPPVIYQLHSIVQLFLNYNKITQLQPGIANLRHLVTLDLSHNKLTTIPDEIGELTSLSSLTLANNHIVAIPDTLTKCAQLTQFDIAHNSLAALPVNLGDLKGLKKLSVKYNQLRELPVSLARCGSIEYLNVENNLLDSIDQTVFDALVNARIVILSRNSLTSLPCMDALVYLDSFAAEYNQIGELDEDVFSFNQRLASLNLKSNHIGSLPLDLSVWSHIKEINLSSNRLTTIPESIGALRNVVELRLSNNKITELPDQIGALKELKVLELDENELTYVSNYIGECNQLTKLILTSNRISSLPTDIGDLAILTHLYIGENRIFSIPPHIGKMASLKELYINDNADLQNLPLELSYCKSLQILSIEGCPLGDIPSDFQHGPSYVIHYLRLRANSVRNQSVDF